MAEDEFDPKDTLHKFTEGPKLLREAVEGLDDTGLDLIPEAEGWTIREIVHHVADGDLYWKVCILMALGGVKEPFHLAWYWDRPQERWGQAWHYGGRDIEASLTLLEANRRQMVELLDGIEGAFEKTITVRWPGGDEQLITVGWIIAMQTGHVERHIEDVQRTKAQHNV
jgi:hypothetical protein